MITHLTKGSRYRIVSASSTEENFITEGILEGFISMGEEPALLIKIVTDDKERMRIIPVNSILMIDIIEQVNEEKENTKNDTFYIS